MCYKCIDRATKLKQSHRRSNENPTAATTTTKVNQLAQVINEGDKSMMSDLLSMMTKMNEDINQLKHNTHVTSNRFSDTDCIGNESSASKINRDIITLHAKIDHSLKLQSESNAQISSMLRKKFDELLNVNVNHTQSTPISPHLTRMVALAQPALNKQSSKILVDPLDWSFSFKNSVSPNDTDIYQLLHSFEQNTWSSFDYLCKKVNDLTDTVQTIDSSCKELNVNLKGENQQLRSPTLDSITLDNLQVINERCDSIEKNLLAVGSSIQSMCSDLIADGNTTNNSTQFDNIRSSLIDIDKKISYIETTIASMNESPLPALNLTSYESLNDHTTQQLSERFKALLSDDNNRPTKSAIQSDIVHLLTPNVPTPTDGTVDIGTKQEFYVSKFATTTTAAMILEYMRNNGVTNTSSVKVRCLIPRSKDRSTLTFVSFKIDTESLTVAKAITAPGFWPHNCNIRTFCHKPIIDLSSQGTAHNSSNFFHHPGIDQTPM